MRRSASLLTTLLAASFVFLSSGCQSSYIPKGEKLPEKFPINCYPQSTCTKADSTPLPGNQVQQIAVLMTDDDVAKVVAWYKTELTFKSYRILSDNEKNGAITLEADAEKLHCTVNCTPISEGKKTIISISVFPKPN